MTPYDLVEYPSRAFSQTHPQRLAAIAVLMGLQRPKITNCRVLDVGCGSGWNLLPMAYEMPHAEFFGFDLAETPIAAAKADAEALGLSNIRFQALDLLQFPADAGQFDYIIAHGFYSWVPHPVRAALLDVCRRHLSPDGIAFISYNANPFGHFRRMWREMMQHHIAGKQNPLQLAEELLCALRTQYATKAKLMPYSRLVESQLNAINQGGGNWFVHDDLGPVFDPISISQFASEIGHHGLMYVGDALFENLRPEASLPEGLLSTDRIEIEQYSDYLIGRGFRNSLVTHAGRDLGHFESAFEQLFYSAPLHSSRSGGVTTFRNEWSQAEAEVGDPGLSAAMDCIRKAWPGNASFQELCAAGGDGVQPQLLLELIVNEVIVPSVSPRSFPKQSHTVWAPARLQASRGEIVVTNRLHGAVQLEDEQMKSLVASLDLDPTSNDERLAWLRRAVLLA